MGHMAESHTVEPLSALSLQRRILLRVATVEAFVVFGILGVAESISLRK